MVGDRAAVALSAIERVFACSVDPAFSQAAAEIGKRRRRPPPMTRGLSYEVSYKVEVTDADHRMNTFDADFHAVLLQWTHVLAQVDPSVPLHRQQKLVACRPQAQRYLTIGINGSFVQVTACCKVRGGESELWQRLVDQLLPPEHQARFVSNADVDLAASPSAASPSTAFSPSTAGSPSAMARRRSSVLPSLNRVASSASMAASDVDGAAAELGATTLQRDRMLATPFGAAAERELASYSLSLGKPEEGGIALTIPVFKAEDVAGILSRLAAIPELLAGMTHHSVFVETRVEFHGSVASYEQLRLHAKGWYSIPADRMAMRTEAATRAALLAGKPEPDPLEGLSPCFMDTPIMTSYLSTICAAQQLRRPGEYISKLSSGRWVRLEAVRPRVHRITDLDDPALDTIMRRVRPTGGATMYTHTGLALCVVALTGSAETKARQAVELAKVSQQGEAYCGVRFLLWDVAEPLKADAKDPVRRERLVKLLDNIKGAIPVSCMPALLVLDVFKKRYYRTRLATGCSLFPAAQIGAFVDDFVRGSLHDLLPPVKGCRVYGGSVCNTKYTLIAV
jgi:hypothetical protein